MAENQQRRAQEALSDSGVAEPLSRPQPGHQPYTISNAVFPHQASSGGLSNAGGSVGSITFLRANETTNVTASNRDPTQAGRSSLESKLQMALEEAAQRKRTNAAGGVVQTLSASSHRDDNASKEGTTELSARSLNASKKEQLLSVEAAAVGQSQEGAPPAVTSLSRTKSEGRRPRGWPQATLPSALPHTDRQLEPETGSVIAIGRPPTSSYLERTTSARVASIDPALPQARGGTFASFRTAAAGRHASDVLLVDHRDLHHGSDFHGPTSNERSPTDSAAEGAAPSFGIQKRSHSMTNPPAAVARRRLPVAVAGKAAASSNPQVSRGIVTPKGVDTPLPLAAPQPPALNMMMSALSQWQSNFRLGAVPLAEAQDAGGDLQDATHLHSAAALIRPSSSNHCQAGGSSLTDEEILQEFASQIPQTPTSSHAPLTAEGNATIRRNASYGTVISLQGEGSGRKVEGGALRIGERRTDSGWRTASGVDEPLAAATPALTAQQQQLALAMFAQQHGAQSPDLAAWSQALAGEAHRLDHPPAVPLQQRQGQERHKQDVAHCDAQLSNDLEYAQLQLSRQQSSTSGESHTSLPVAAQGGSEGRDVVAPKTANRISHGRAACSSEPSWPAAAVTGAAKAAAGAGGTVTIPSPADWSDGKIMPVGKRGEVRVRDCSGNAAEDNAEIAWPREACGQEGRVLKQEHDGVREEVQLSVQQLQQWWWGRTRRQGAVEEQRSRLLGTSHNDGSSSSRQPQGGDAAIVGVGHAMRVEDCEEWMAAVIAMHGASAQGDGAMDLLPQWLSQWQDVVTTQAGSVPGSNPPPPEGTNAGDITASRAVAAALQTADVNGRGAALTVSANARAGPDDALPQTGVLNSTSWGTPEFDSGTLTTTLMTSPQGAGHTSKAASEARHSCLEGIWVAQQQLHDQLKRPMWVPQEAVRRSRTQSQFNSGRSHAPVPGATLDAAALSGPPGRIGGGFPTAPTAARASGARSLPRSRTAGAAAAAAAAVAAAAAGRGGRAPFGVPHGVKLSDEAMNRMGMAARPLSMMEVRTLTLALAEAVAASQPVSCS